MVVMVHWLIGSPLLALRVKRGDLRCAARRFMLACWHTYMYFNIVSNIVNKKMAKNQFFFVCGDKVGSPLPACAGINQSKTLRGKSKNKKSVKFYKSFQDNDLG